MDNLRSPHMPRRPLIAYACAVALLALNPAKAAAQRDAFVDAFIDFHSQLSGTYGDEGPAVVAALDRMAASLDAWDAANRRVEAELQSRTPPAPSDLALLYVEWGRHDLALRAIDAAIQAEPARAAFHTFRGLILDAAGRRDEAVAALTAAFTLDPDDPVTAYLLADRRPGDGADVEPQLASLLASYQRSGTLFGPRLRAPFMRLTLIDDRAADTPRFSPASYAEGFALVARGRYREAIAHFREAAARDPLVADPAARSVPLSQGIAALRQGRFETAIEQLEAAVASWPSSPEAHRILGAAYGAGGRHPESVARLEAAIRLSPRDERARVTLGRELAHAGRWQDAERAHRETIGALPDSGDARWALADVYETLGRGIDVIAELEAAASLTVLAGKGQVYWRLAELSHTLQQYERVVDALSRRARLMPNEAGAYKDVGLARYRLGRQERALVDLIMAALLGLEDGETLTVIGQIHLNAGRHTAAETALRRAIARDPASAPARYALGRTLLGLGKEEEAKAELAEFQRLRTEALEEQRRAFELELRRRDTDRPPAEAGR